MPVTINGTTGLITAGATSSGGGGVSTNTALGGDALATNTTGQFNTAIGFNTGNVSNANRGTYIGHRAGVAKTTGDGNTFIGSDCGTAATTGEGNTFMGQGCGELITTGGKNTLLGKYNGNSADLDLRTASNRIVLADGDGNPKIYMSNDGVTRLFNAYQNTLTSNSKGGTVTILPRDVFFPPSYFAAIDTCTIIINCVASEGTGGGYTRTDILHVNYRFGYNVASLASNASDGISVSTWSYSFDSNGLRVTQNWGASGGSLGSRWTFFITGCLFQG